MNRLHAFVFSVVIAAPVSGFAQSAPDAGILGQRYLEVSAGGISASHSSGAGFAGGIRFSIPVLSHTNISVGYDERDGRSERLAGFYAVKQHSEAANLDLTQSFATSGIKPFVTAGIGYQPVKRELTYRGYMTSSVRAHEGEWRIGAGVEIPLAAVTLTPTIQYYGGITNRGDGWDWEIMNGHPRGSRYSIEAARWLTTRVGAFVAVEYDRLNNEFHIIEPLMRPDIYPVPSGPSSEDVQLGSANHAWSYRVGIRYRF